MMPKLPDLDGKIAGYLPDFVVGGYGLPALWKADVERLLIAYGRAVAEACAALCESARNDLDNAVKACLDAPVRYPEYNEACDDCAAAIREMASVAKPE